MMDGGAQTCRRPERVGRGRVLTVRVFVLAAFVLALPRLAFPISLVDVVELSQAGWNDDAIIHLIEVTGSRFVLDAEAQVTLKAEGVSETVIQALLEARDPEAHQSSETAASSEASPSGPPGDHGSASVHTYSATPEAARTVDQPPVPAVPSSTTDTLEISTSGGAVQEPGVFSAFPFEETSGGHGSSHQHYLVTVHEVPMLVLRSEAGYPGISARALALVRRLNGMIQYPEGHFFAASGPTPAVRYRVDTSDRTVHALEVSRGDVIAYQRRSLGKVSAERLAAYWAAVLNDYTQLFLFGRPPTELAELHLGEALSSIYDDLGSITEDPEEAGEFPLLRLLDHLAAEDKEHLIELSTRIPAEFHMP